MKRLLEATSILSLLALLMHKYADNFVQDTVILLTNHYGAGSDKGISLSTNSENFGSSKEIC